MLPLVVRWRWCDEAGGQGRFAGGKSVCGRRLVVTVRVGGVDGGSGGGVGEVGGVEVVFSSTSVGGVDRVIDVSWWR